MDRTKKITVTAMAAALLMGAAGMSSAIAANNGKVTICHSTGSQSHPFHKITVSQNAADAHMTHHAGRDTVPDANGNCPTTPPDGEDHAITVCHKEAGAFTRFHFEEGDNGFTAHLEHNDDEIVEDDNNNHLCPTTPPPVEENDQNCSASSSSGDSTAVQRGLINIGNVDLGLNNLGSNILCQSNIANYLTAAVLGVANGGSGSDAGSAGDNCTADSTTGNSSADQEGLVNVGNVGLGLDNLGSNILCQADIANYVTAAILGVANGGSGSDAGSAGDNCTADSTSGDSSADQDGLVNVGNLDVDANNALSNVLCQAEILDYLTLSVLGHATGGPSVLGTGLLGGGDLLGPLTNLLDADASLLAKLVVIL